MRRLTAAAFLLVLALTGCFQLTGRTSEARSDEQAAWARCEQQREIGRLRTHVAAVDCAVKPVLAAYEDAAYPFMDIVYVSIQARRRGAQRVDAGEISEQQYRRDVTALEGRLAAEEKRRNDIQLFGGRATPTPPEQLVGGLPSFAPEARASAPAPTANGCVPLGAIKSCN
ncbi:MAG TPA: hypothetical protein VLV50_20350 [Stellaceae bacterium]|nr:hypothetical protein [Stellaceae bacterium]